MYISRIDDDIVTYDIRMVKPNTPPFLENAGLHSFEHLFATFMRNSDYRSNIVYVGPMGCRTGCYLLVFGEKSSEDIYPLILELCDFIIGFEGEIPGAKPEECGNYSEQNLSMAKYYIAEYKKRLIENKSFEYNYL